MVCFQLFGRLCVLDPDPDPDFQKRYGGIWPNYGVLTLDAVPDPDPRERIGGIFPNVGL